MAFSALPTFGLMKPGLRKNLVRITATRHDTNMISYAVGFGALAAMGVKIVTIMAVELHVPKTRPMNLLGKYCKILMNSPVIPPPVQNFASSCVNVIRGPFQLKEMLIQMMMADIAARLNKSELPLTSPALRTIKPAKR